MLGLLGKRKPGRTMKYYPKRFGPSQARFAEFPFSEMKTAVWRVASGSELFIEFFLTRLAVKETIILKLQLLHLQNLALAIFQSRHTAVISVTRQMFLDDPQGKTFADVLSDPQHPFDTVLEFLKDADRQKRLEESELHHDRPALAGVIRELEAQAAIERFFKAMDSKRCKRLRQAIGVVIRIIMERRGWKKTGRKGSLGVREAPAKQMPTHNTGGLSFWFVRAERYERKDGMPFCNVKERCKGLEAAEAKYAGRG